jgi:hypothetical protein
MSAEPPPLLRQVANLLRTLLELVGFKIIVGDQSLVSRSGEE